MKPFALLHASPTPIRSRLFRDLLAVIVLTIGVLIGANLLLIEDFKHDMAETRINNAKALVRDEVQALLQPVQQQLLIIRDRLRNAAAAPPQTRAAAERMNAKLMPSLIHIPQIAGLAFADGQGREYFLRRADSGWLTRLRGPGDAAEFTLLHWAQLDEPGNSETARLDYDPRLRPWFKEARQTLAQRPEQSPDQPRDQHDTFSWTPPYRFDSLNKPGITVSSAWYVGEALRVLALDVTLAHILEMIDQLPLESGSGFLFDGQGGLYSDRHAPNQSSGVQPFYSAETQQGGPLHFNAIAAWRAAGRPDDRLVRFSSGGRDWWGGFLPLTGDAEDAWVGVALPTSATLGILQSRWFLLALTALGILTLGIGLAALLVRKYSHQLRELPKRSLDTRHPEADIQALISRGESTHLEFKSTLRMNLHTGKAGKEIELAWLKGVVAFLNTEGGILLIGVADDGEVLGLDADGFANDDKFQLHFKNLINSHLGAEYSRFLQLEIYRIEDKSIAVVECEPAEAPSFLRHKGTESFLIRNGPSNIELPISKALTYIAARF
ncbi:RNA-binding domain-containing protein [Rhabdochromatium marinum]|uniref:RNA-binding domain-containing protein n=1 Tax=Rhabdochromatium marinum TaxID=48729 RepID=UPI001905230D|nr:RNA-binding domain-containing protein [Rhabdochromatium marinum]MBK1647071.1 AAA family ATPase [Rhabdochromatium marinum]